MSVHFLGYIRRCSLRDLVHPGNDYNWSSIKTAWPAAFSGTGYAVRDVTTMGHGR
jgi:hypothetical protein